MFKQIKYRAEFGLVLFFDAVLTLLPYRWALGLGQAVGLFFSFVLKKRRRLVLENLRRAFPERADPELRRIASQVWKNLGRVAVEFIRLPRISAENYENFFSYEGVENFEEAEHQGKGVIIITFHFSNWEMAGVGHQFWKNKLVAIARPMKNPYVEKWVQRKRQGGGMDIILHRKAVRASFKILKAKKHLAILVDQNIYTGGVFVDFFGRPAATTTLPALLHSRTDSPVVLAYPTRINGKYKISYGPPLKFPPVEEAADRIKEYTQIITSAVESVVRDHPESWLWLHNRWKRSP